MVRQMGHDSAASGELAWRLMVRDISAPNTDSRFLV